MNILHIYTYVDTHSKDLGTLQVLPGGSRLEQSNTICDTVSRVESVLYRPSRATFHDGRSGVWMVFIRPPADGMRFSRVMMNTLIVCRILYTYSISGWVLR